MFDWIVAFIQQTGELGIALLMFAENVFPPIPSEAVMPLAGFSAARGDLSLIGIIAAGACGSVLGALFWYYVGAWVGIKKLKAWSARYERWLTFGPEEIDQAIAWFERYGVVAVGIGRLIPAIRSLISIPAGISRLGLLPFFLSSLVGTLVWTAFLAVAGFLLESQYEKVAAWVNPISNVVVGVFLVWYLYRVVTYKRPEFN